MLVSCVQSNKYNQPQLVEAVEIDTAECESLSPTIVVRKMIIVLQMKFSRIIGTFIRIVD